MALLRPTVWTSQPQVPVGIDWSNPLTRDIISAVHAPSGTLVLPRGNIQRLSQNTVPAKGTRSAGVSLEFDGANNSFTHAITPRSKEEITFVVWFYQNTSAVSDKRICGISLSTAGSGNHWSLGTGTTDGTKLKLYASNQIESATGSIANNVLKKAAATFGATMEIYDNGIQVASGIPAIGMATYDRICYGSLVRSSNLAALNGGIVFAASWNRKLSAAEIKSVTDNPWQIFGPIQRRIFVPDAATGTTVSPSSGNGIYAGYSPSVSQSANQSLTPGAAHGTFTGHAPTVTSAANITVSPSVGHGSYSGYMPTVQQTAGQVIAPSAANAVFAGHAPTIEQHHTLAPDVGHMVYNGYAPTVTITAGQIISPTVAHGVLSGNQPIVVRTDSRNIEPGSCHATYAGHAPTISIGVPGEYPSAESIAAATVSAMLAEIFPANIKEVNSIPIKGAGIPGDTWGPI